MLEIGDLDIMWYILVNFGVQFNKFHLFFTDGYHVFRLHMYVLEFSRKDLILMSPAYVLVMARLVGRAWESGHQIMTNIKFMVG